MLSFLNQSIPEYDSESVVTIVNESPNTDKNNVISDKKTNKIINNSQDRTAEEVSLDNLGIKYGYGRVNNYKKVGKQSKEQFLGGDKSSAGRNYLNDYQELLKDFRSWETGFRLLEIGVLEGRSMAMWSDYFPRAELVGMDICLDYLNEKMLREEMGAFSNNNVKFLEGDSTVQDSAMFEKYGLEKFDPGELGTNGEILSKGVGGYNVILDDGDHHWESQMQTFDNLFFDYLRPGGIFIIEDCFQSQIIVHFSRIMVDVLACGTRTLSRPEQMKEYFLKMGKTNKYLRYVEAIKIERSRIIIWKRSF